MITADACPLVFDADRHLYALDGVVVPSVTQVLRQTRYVRLVEDLMEAAERGESDWLATFIKVEARLRVLDVARSRGQRVHAALHYLLEGDLDMASLDEETAGYMASATAYLEREVTSIVAAERRVWSKRHCYAGTLDMLAYHRSDGRLSLDDFKSGNPDDVAADLQTAAYLNAVLEMDALPSGTVINRRSIRLYRDGRTATETLYRDPLDFRRFLNALNVVHDQARRPVPVLAWDDER